MIAAVAEHFKVKRLVFAAFDECLECPLAVD
jgi:hypothetical protein